MPKIFFKSSYLTHMIYPMTNEWTAEKPCWTFYLKKHNRMGSIGLCLGMNMTSIPLKKQQSSQCPPNMPDLLQ